MVGSDTDLDYLDRAARHFDGMTVLKREGQPYHDDPGHPINGGNEFETYGIPMSKFAIPPGHINGLIDDQGALESIPVFGQRPMTATQAREQERLIQQLREDRRDFRNKWIAETERADIAEAALKGMSKGIEERLNERYRVLGENQAYKAAAEHLKLAAEGAIKLADERFQQYVDANERAIDLQTQLDIQTAETQQCMARIKQLEAELASLRPEPKPNTHDMSRLGHFGESHAKNGLSLYDRYY